MNIGVVSATDETSPWALLWWRMFPNPDDHEWRDRAVAYVTVAARLDR